MLQQEQRVRNAVGLAVVHKLTLQLERVGVRHDPKAAYLEGTH